jgi:fibronectin-binding autotransporter adhesin
MKPKSPFALCRAYTQAPAAIALASALLSLVSTQGVRAADVTWSGATDGAINTATNWLGGVLPSNTSGTGNPPTPPSDRWVFGVAGAGGTTLTGARNFGGMIFNAGAPAYTIGTTSDNVAWNVTSSAITNNSSNIQTINYNLAMAAGRTFTGSTAGGDIIANGLLSGNGNITKSGTNNLTITNAGSTLSNNFILNGGGTLTFGAVATVGARSLGAPTAGTGTFTVTGATLAATPGVTLTANSAINNLNMNAASKFTMADGVYNTFEVRGATVNLSGTTGVAPTFNFNLGDTASADVLAITGTPTFSFTGPQINITPVTALTVGNTYTVVTAAGGLDAANSFVLGTGVAVFGNTSYILSISKTATNVSIGVTSAELAKAFYSGAQGSTLNAGTPGVSSNWVDAVSGGADTLIQPGAATEFNFTATGATNTTIATLGQDYSALSLNFNSNAGSVSINDTASNKITVAAGGINVTGGSHAINVPLVLSAGQTFTNNGALLTLGGSINAGSNILNVTGTGPTTINGNITNSGGLTKDGNGTLTVAGTIGGTGGLIKNGSGSLVFNSANPYAGSTTINQGTISVSTFGAFGTDTGAISMGVSGAAGITYTGTGETSTRNFTTSGGLTNTATFTQSGASGLLKLSGNFTSITANNRNFIFAGSTAGIGEVSGVISNQSIGGGQNTQVTKNGTGTWTLSGPNTYTFTTTVNAGTLRAGVATVAGVSGAFGINGGVSLANTAGATLDLNGFDTQVGSISGGGATGGNITLGSATLTTGAGGNPYSGVISGTGGLTKIGTGTLTLAGVNTYSGDTTVTSGTLAVNGNSIADANKLILDGGKLDIAAAANETVNSLYFGAAEQSLGTYGSTASAAAIKDDTRFSGTGILTVTSGAPVSDYNAWLALYTFAPGADTTATGDADGDGLNNQQEHAFGLDPSSGSSINPILVPLDRTSGAFTFTYMRRKPSLTGLTSYKILSSTDLITWSVETTAVQTPTDTGDNQSVAVSLTAPFSEPKLFFRVSAE